MENIIHPAATVVLLRDGPKGIEVFLLRRNPEIGGKHFGDAFLFPGGAVDEVDSNPAWGHICADSQPIATETLTGTHHNPLTFWVAAIRECYEEAAILFANRRHDDGPIDQTELDQWRNELESDGSFLKIVERENLVLLPQDLVYFSHWITPESRPKRFDTRFFIARAPSGQNTSHDGVETIDSAWLSPRKALEQFADGEIFLWPPTHYTLLAITEYQTVSDMLSVRRQRIPSSIPVILPRLVKTDRGVRPIFPWDDQ